MHSFITKRNPFPMPYTKTASSIINFDFWSLLRQIRIRYNVQHPIVFEGFELSN